MKKSTLFAIAFGCLTAFGITSCIESDDNSNSSNGLTAAQKAQCYALVKGQYTGQLIYWDVNAEDLLDQTDTISAKWAITNDSTLIIENFPARLLADNLNYKSMKDALAEAPDQTLTCYINFVNTTPVEFLAHPYTLEYNLNYGGRDHVVDVAFYVNTTYSFGSYDVTNGSLEIQIIEGMIFEDGQQTSYLSTLTPFIFVSKQQESI